MRKPTVDYREFRLTKLTDPLFSHLLLLLGWVVYFALYVLTERLFPAENCKYLMHSALDDIIPFCEWFVIPYVFWYALIVVSLLYFLLYNVDSFKRLQIFIMITQAVAMAIYIAFPNWQDLRPDLTQLGRENPLTQLVGLLYAADTETNVCPSLHVAYSLGIASVWLKEKTASRPWKAFVVVAVVLICLSTAFIKQHSVLDIFAALPLGLLAEGLVYGRDYWRPRLLKQQA